MCAKNYSFLLSLYTNVPLPEHTLVIDDNGYKSVIYLPPVDPGSYNFTPSVGGSSFLVNARNPKGVIYGSLLEGTSLEQVLQASNIARANQSIPYVGYTNPPNEEMIELCNGQFGMESREPSIKGITAGPGTCAIPLK
jgi:hypothetical protein